MWDSTVYTGGDIQHRLLALFVHVYEQNIVFRIFR